MDTPIIPWNLLYDIEPDYRVYAGLTFVQLNRNFLSKWGNSWITDIPFDLRYLFFEFNQLNENPLRREYVVISEILPDEVNSYLQSSRYRVIESVNGITINRLEDIDTAVQTDVDGFWIVEFIGYQSPMVIDANKARNQQDAILQKYQLPMETKTHEKEFLF